MLACAPDHPNFISHLGTFEFHFFCLRLRLAAVNYSICSSTLLRNKHYKLTLTSLLFVLLSIAELNLLTGIAAILTYPLDVEVVEAEERAEAEKEALEATEGNAEEEEGEGKGGNSIETGRDLTVEG